MLRRIVLALILLVTAAAAGLWWTLQPRHQAMPLPAPLIALDSAQGQRWLAGAEAAADYPALHRHFEPQRLISWCGVASGTTVLAALGQGVTQDSFFSEAARQVRSPLAVSLGGMSLPELGALLRAHGAHVEIRHAGAFSLADFRRVVAANLGDPGDFLLVNYQREVLGQGRVGHISPVGAYHRDSDRVLILDTASYRYPYTWVPLTALYQAMAEVDPASGQTRGFAVVRQLSSGL